MLETGANKLQLVVNEADEYIIGEDFAKKAMLSMLSKIETFKDDLSDFASPKVELIGKDGKVVGILEIDPESIVGKSRQELLDNIKNLPLLIQLKLSHTPDVNINLEEDSLIDISVSKGFKSEARSSVLPQKDEIIVPNDIKLKMNEKGRYIIDDGVITAALEKMKEQIGTFQEDLSDFVNPQVQLFGADGKVIATLEMDASNRERNPTKGRLLNVMKINPAITQFTVFCEPEVGLHNAVERMQVSIENLSDKQEKQIDYAIEQRKKRQKVELEGLQSKQDKFNTVAMQRRQEKQEEELEALKSRAGKAEIKKTLEKHLEDRAVASTKSFKRTAEEKDLGQATGYIAERESDQHKFMLKHAFKSDAATIGTSSKITERNQQDRIDFVSEFLTGGIYKRLLYDRAPIIELTTAGGELYTTKLGKKEVERLKPDVDEASIYVRSKFLDEFQTLRAFSGYSGNRKYFDTESPKLAQIEGFEKVMAASLMMGETDYHSENIGVVKKLGEDGQEHFIAVKIDHGRSTLDTFSIEHEFRKAMLEGFEGVSYIEGGKATIPFSAEKFKTSIDEMLKISEDEIKNLVENRVELLKRAGFDFKDIDFNYFENIEEVGAKPGTPQEVADLYLLKLKKQLVVMREFSETLDIVVKSDAPAEIKNGDWIASLGTKDPIEWAIDNKYKIEGQDPIEWAINKNRKIEGIDAVGWAIINGHEIEGQGAVEWAIDNNRKIEGKTPTEWVKEYIAKQKPPTVLPEKVVDEPLSAPPSYALFGFSGAYTISQENMDAIMDKMLERGVKKLNLTDLEAELEDRVKIIGTIEFKDSKFYYTPATQDINFSIAQEIASEFIRVEPIVSSHVDIPLATSMSLFSIEDDSNKYKIDQFDVTNIQKYLKNEGDKLDLRDPVEDKIIGTIELKNGKFLYTPVSGITITPPSEQAHLFQLNKRSTIEMLAPITSSIELLPDGNQVTISNEDLKEIKSILRTEGDKVDLLDMFDGSTVMGTIELKGGKYVCTPAPNYTINTAPEIATQFQILEPAEELSPRSSLQVTVPVKKVDANIEVLVEGRDIGITPEVVKAIGARVKKQLAKSKDPQTIEIDILRSGHQYLGDEPIAKVRISPQYLLALGKSGKELTDYLKAHPDDIQFELEQIDKRIDISYLRNTKLNTENRFAGVDINKRVELSVRPEVGRIKEDEIIITRNVVEKNAVGLIKRQLLRTQVDPASIHIELVDAKLKGLELGDAKAIFRISDASIQELEQIAKEKKIPLRKVLLEEIDKYLDGKPTKLSFSITPLERGLKMFVTADIYEKPTEKNRYTPPKVVVEPTKAEIDEAIKAALNKDLKSGELKVGDNANYKRVVSLQKDGQTYRFNINDVHISNAGELVSYKSTLVRLGSKAQAFLQSLEDQGKDQNVIVVKDGIGIDEQVIKKTREHLNARIKAGEKPEDMMIPFRNNKMTYYLKLPDLVIDDKGVQKFKLAPINQTSKDFLSDFDAPKAIFSQNIISDSTTRNIEDLRIPQVQKYSTEDFVHAMRKIHAQIHSDSNITSVELQIKIGDKFKAQLSEKAIQYLKAHKKFEEIDLSKVTLIPNLSLEQKVVKVDGKDVNKVTVVGANIEMDSLLGQNFHDSAAQKRQEVGEKNKTGIVEKMQAKLGKVKKPEKSAKMMMTSDGAVWEFSSPKPAASGANEAGELGGIYKSASGVKALFKRDPKPQKNIAEFLASQMHRTTHPDTHAEVMFVAPKNLGEDPYIASIFIKNYAGDLYADAYKQSGLEEPKERPRMQGTRNLLAKLKTKITGEKSSSVLENAFDTQGYTNFGGATAVRLLTNDMDMHSGNLGVVRDPYGVMKPKLVSIDFGGANASLESKIHPHSHTRHPFGMGPSNHFREYQRRHKLTPEFVAECDKVVNADYSKVIESAFADIKKHNTVEAIRKFGSDLGVPKAALNKAKGNKDDLTEVIKNHYQDIMKQRQQDLAKFSVQIKVDLCVQKDVAGKWKVGSYTDVDGKKVTFEDVVKQNKDYFQAIVDGKEQFKLRDKSHIKHFRSISKIVIAEAKVVLENEKRIEAERVKVAKQEEAVQIQREKEPIITNVKTINPIVPEDGKRTIVNVQLPAGGLVDQDAMWKVIEGVQKAVREGADPNKIRVRFNNDDNMVFAVTAIDAEFLKKATKNQLNRENFYMRSEFKDKQFLRIAPITDTEAATDVQALTMFGKFVSGTVVQEAPEVAAAKGQEAVLQQLVARGGLKPLQPIIPEVKAITPSEDITNQKVIEIDFSRNIGTNNAVLINNSLMYQVVEQVQKEIKAGTDPRDIKIKFVQISEFGSTTYEFGIVGIDEKFMKEASTRQLSKINFDELAEFREIPFLHIAPATEEAKRNMEVEPAMRRFVDNDTVTEALKYTNKFTTPVVIAVDESVHELDKRKSKTSVHREDTLSAQKHEFEGVHDLRRSTTMDEMHERDNLKSKSSVHSVDIVAESEQEMEDSHPITVTKKATKGKTEEQSEPQKKKGVLATIGDFLSGLFGGAKDKEAIEQTPKKPIPKAPIIPKKLPEVRYIDRIKKTDTALEEARHSKKGSSIDHTHGKKKSISPEGVKHSKDSSTNITH